MSLYRRYFLPGGTYFFTLVTEERRTLFAENAARQLLGAKLRECQMRHPFTMIAVVVLPDHVHMLWSLPPNDNKYSARLNWIKGQFTRDWLAQGGCELPQQESRKLEGRRGIWQRRFWEHTVRDERDLENHANYIHYNPVKHGYVESPSDWEWSSFHRFVAAGEYSANWGSLRPPRGMPKDVGE